jgi:hypothetical protein
MKKKVLMGVKENDPEWIQDISCYFFTYRINEKTDEYKKKLRELFLEYRNEGMKAKGSMKKAKLLLDYFGIE